MDEKQNEDPKKSDDDEQEETPQELKTNEDNQVISQEVQMNVETQPSVQEITTKSPTRDYIDLVYTYIDANHEQIIEQSMLNFSLDCIIYLNQKFDPISSIHPRDLKSVIFSFFIFL